MYNLNNYPDIINGLKSISAVFKQQSNGWIQIFCPYCNDSSRKSGYLSHGHFYISTTFNYCHCFRCEYASSFTKFLKDLGYNDINTLKDLSKQSGNYVFSNSKNRTIIEEDIKNKIYQIYDSFKETNLSDLKSFFKYVYSRCLCIDPSEFLLYPNIIKGELTCGFFNYNGVPVCSRYINNLNLRYSKDNVTDYYFFQNINRINTYSNIVVCEGGFDLINLYSYSPLFKSENSFYIAINGRDYRKIIRDLINDYLLIGSYNINVVFDQGIKDIEKIKYFHGLNSKQLNPNIKFNYFKPLVSKDVSEIMSLIQI